MFFILLTFIFFLYLYPQNTNTQNTNTQNTNTQKLIKPDKILLSEKMTQQFNKIDLIKTPQDNYIIKNLQMKLDEKLIKSDSDNETNNNIIKNLQKKLDEKLMKSNSDNETNNNIIKNLQKKLDEKIMKSDSNTKKIKILEDKLAKIEKNRSKLINKTSELDCKKMKILEEKLIKAEQKLAKIKSKSCSSNIKKNNQPIIRINKPMVSLDDQIMDVDPVYIRDKKVLDDPLYPPLGRTDRPTFDLLMRHVNTQPDIFNNYTRGPPDTFRQLGYLTPKDKSANIDNILILFGRAKYPNSDIGEFYLTSSNKLSDIKIPVDQYTSNIKKITDVPCVVNIFGNLFKGTYDYMELPKADFMYPYI
jgi:hypothetical protein